MFAVFVDAPTDADFFETLDGFPVAVGLVALRGENDFFEFLGHFQILFSQLFAGGQAGTDGLALALRVEIVHVSSASGVAEGLAAVALLVESVAQNGGFARAQGFLLETNVARLGTADGKFAQRRQMALVSGRAAGTHGSAIDGAVTVGISERLAVSAGIVQSGKADGQRRARSSNAVDLDDSTLFRSGAALDAGARVATSTNRAAGRVQLVSVSQAVKLWAFRQSRTASWSVALRLKTGRDSSSGQLSAIAGNAPTGPCERIALNGLESSVFRPAFRDEKSIGRHSVLPGLVLHDHLHVLAGRLDQRLDALGSATI